MIDRLPVCMLVLATWSSGCTDSSRPIAVPSAGSAAAGAGGSAAGVGGASGSAGASPSGTNTKFPPRNLLTGGCELTHSVADPSKCTGWDEGYECVASNCELAACEQTCAAYTACALAAPDACDVEATCPKSPACAACHYALLSCAIEPCQLLVRCVTPAADGACSKLTACCETQMNPASCHAYVDRAAQIMGDAVCQMFIDDPSVLDTFFNNPPCKF
jgi:hypothetical protein